MDDIAAALPLREPTFLILTALASGPAHGYGILRSVETPHVWKASSGGLVLLPGEVFVVGGVVGEAAVEDADPAVGELA
jgi:hypothetical protein